MEDKILILGIIEEILGASKTINETTFQYGFNCPVCAQSKGMDSDGKYNFEVSLSLGKFNCWACGESSGTHGNIPRLIRRWGNPGHLERYHQIEPEYIHEVKKDIWIDPELPAEFIPFSTADRTDRDCNNALQYLYERGYDDALIEYNGLGYCPSGKFGGRIIIPSYNRHGKLNYFIGRAYYKSPKKKYKNCDNDSSAIIFNEHRINWEATIYLVEGAFDGPLFLPNTIPMLGKNIGNYLFECLVHKAKGNIVFIMDPDASNDSKKKYHTFNDLPQLQDRVYAVMLQRLDMGKIFQDYGFPGIIRAVSSARRLSQDWERPAARKGFFQQVV